MTPRETSAAGGPAADGEGMTYSSGRWPYWPAATTLVVGLVVSAVLFVVSHDLNVHNEKRLLDLRARDVATVLTAALPSVQTPLASAAALADATGGSAPKFRRLIAPYVGEGATRPFVSASLWRVDASDRGPVALVGVTPEMHYAMQRAPAFFARASVASHLTVIGFLSSAPLRLGYAYTGAVRGPFAAYAESALPADRYSPTQQNKAFSDIDFALYLDSANDSRNLLIASVRRLPLRGRTVTVRVPFGDASFTVMVAARGALGGSLPRRLPVVIAIVGVLLTFGATALALGLIEGRRRAERLAGRLEVVARENERLYAEQRGIAQTLQHSLLPESLPELPGLRTGARYQAGVEGVDVGGDWYDLIAIDSRRLLLVVGDVSGRGLRAATTMAALRYAIHAYAAQGDPPETLLAKLSRLVSIRSDGQLATVLCVLIDVPGRRVSVTSAGHLPPLVVSPSGCEYLDCEVGLPVGVAVDSGYSESTAAVPEGATVLAFTDGLVERRGEPIDAGLERLRATACSAPMNLDELLTRVLRDLPGGEASDDTAVAGVQWVN